MLNQYTVPIVPDSLITTPTAPDSVIAARAALEKLRAAAARASETASATAGQIAEAEKAYRSECATAALNGTAHPKTPAALRDLRDRAETAQNVATDLAALLESAKGEHENAVCEWGWSRLREQHASDAAEARKAFSEAIEAFRRMLPFTGSSGRDLLVAFLADLPRGDFGRVARYQWVGPLFGEISFPNPLNQGGPALEAEANFLTALDARSAAATFA
jgi:hypothetical protein